MARKISKKERWFQIINTILVVGILSFYFGRMFYYKKKLALIYQNSNYEALSTVMVERNDLIAEDRIYENEDGSYYFKGNITNNYISFGGLLYRAVSIDTEGNIRMILDQSITASVIPEETSFETTSLFQWLNKTSTENSGIFEKALSSHSALMNAGDFNYSTVSDLNNISSDHMVESKISILSIEEYVKAGAANSFLNNGESYWLSNQDQSGKYYYVNSDGALGTSYSEILVLNVRPVITLTYSVRAISGEGTVDDPYIVTDLKPETTKDLYLGAYITYSGYLFRVESADKNGAVVMLVSPLEESYYYGPTQMVNTSRGAAGYLNDSFLSTLNTEDLVETEWTYGILGKNYSYLDNYQNSYSSYVGLPTTADFFLNNLEGCHLASAAIQSTDLIYGIKDSILYASYISDEALMVGKICLKPDLVILDGEGTKENPYSLEVNGNE